MARRIRWQILIAVVSSLLVLGLMSYLALTTVAVARPIAGGTYVEGMLAPPRQLNPLVSDPARDPTGADMQALLFDGLMRIGVDGLPAPALAASRPEISADGTVYTFTLRPNLTWHDGTPLTADDVVFTLRAVQKPGFTGDPVARAVWHNVLIDKVGENQVRCTLSAPAAPFLSLATFPILPAHLLATVPVEEWATTAFSRRPIGTGPYQLREIDQQHALLEANPAYYGGRPLLDTIELRFFNDRQQVLAALARGDIAAFGSLSTDVPARTNPPRGSVRYAVPIDTSTVLTFNLTKEPLTDQGLRRALALGLDKDALINDVLHGQAQRLDTPILPGWWAAAPDVAWYPADPARAAETLTSLGYAPGKDGIRVREGQPLAFELITDSTPDHVATAQAIAAQWRQLGIQITVQQLDSAALQQRLNDRTFMMAVHGWQRLGPDPDVTFELWHSSRAETGSNNYAGLRDEQIDTLLTSARQTLDISTRAASYTAFQRRWVDLVPGITLYQPLFIYDAPEELGGLDFTPMTASASGFSAEQLLFGRADRFRNIPRWFLHSAREIRGNLRQSP